MPFGVTKITNVISGDRDPVGFVVKATVQTGGPPPISMMFQFVNNGAWQPAQNLSYLGNNLWQGTYAMNQAADYQLSVSTRDDINQPGSAGPVRFTIFQNPDGKMKPKEGHRAKHKENRRVTPEQPHVYLELRHRVRQRVAFDLACLKGCQAKKTNAWAWLYFESSDLNETAFRNLTKNTVTLSDLPSQLRFKLAWRGQYTLTVVTWPTVDYHPDCLRAVRVRFLAR
jgi:hypothetical protein